MSLQFRGSVFEILLVFSCDRQKISGQDVHEYAFVFKDTVAFPGTGKGKEFSYVLFHNYRL